MATNFQNAFNEVRDVLVRDPNMDVLASESIQELDTVFNGIEEDNRENFRDYCFWRVSYEMLAWKLANSRQPCPDGDLASKLRFYNNLKRVW